MFERREICSGFRPLSCRLVENSKPRPSKAVRVSHPEVQTLFKGRATRPVNDSEKDTCRTIASGLCPMKHQSMLTIHNLFRGLKKLLVGGNISFRAIRILSPMFILTFGSVSVLGQDGSAPMNRAEVLGRLAAGESPSYVALLVKTVGVRFEADDRYISLIRLAGGRGILTDQLSVTRAATGIGSSSTDDLPFENLAKCAELVHIGDNVRAEAECDAAARTDPQSPWPLFALERCMVRMQRQAEALDKMNQATKLAPKLAETHLKLSSILSSLDDPSIAQTHIKAALSLSSNEKIAEAIAELREAARLEPDNGEIHLEISRLYSRLDQSSEQISELREAIRSEHQNIGFYLELANELLNIGDRLGAIHELREAVRFAPLDRSADYTLIATYKELGNREDEVSEIKRFLSLVPDDSHDRLELAELLRSNGALEESAIECLEIMRRAPDDVSLGWAHNTLGNVRLAQERIDEAVNEYAQAVRLIPDEEVPHSNVANLLVRQGRLEEAVDEFHVALNLNQDDPYAHAGLGIALGRQGHLDDAISEFNIALTINPNDETARSSLGHALQLKGDLGSAIQQYEKVLDSHPDSAVTHNNLADIYATSTDPRYRNPPLALEHATRAVELSQIVSPSILKIGFLGTLAQALLLNGKPDEAIRALRQAVAIDSGKASSHAKLGYLLEFTKDHAGAIVEFEQALHIKPDAAEIQNDLAWIYATADDPRYRNPVAALEHATRAVDLSQVGFSGTQRAAYLDTLAEALLLNRKYDEALATEEKAVDLDPSNSEIRNRLDRFRSFAKTLSPL